MLTFPKKHKGIPDGIEQFNWYPREWADDERLPKCILPFMDEIRAFCEVSLCPFQDDPR